MKYRLGLFAAVVGFAAIWLIRDPAPSVDTDEPVTVASVANNGADVLCCMLDRLQRGETLYDLLLRRGLSARLALEAGAALSRALPPSQLREDDTFELYFDREDRLAALTIVRSPVERYELNASASSFQVARTTVPVDTLRRTVYGRLENSLWNGFTEAGAPPGVIVAFTEVFAWSVDFFRDVRAGDAFGVSFPEYRVQGRTVGTGDIEAAYYVRGRDTLWAFAFQEEGRTRYYDFEGRSLRKALMRAPLKFTRVSSGFSRRRLHPVYKKYRPHNGVDYAAPSGTPVYSAGDGRVDFAGTKRGLGRCVEIRHPNGYRTVYGHLSRIQPGIRRGVAVEQRQRIGSVGSTGLATAPHLHYEVWQGRKAVNPRALKLPARGPVPAELHDRFNAVRNRQYARLVPPYGPILASAD